MRRRGPLSLALAGALSLVVVVPAFAADVLIYGPSNATEESVAEGGGHTVTVADEATWGAMTTEQFAAFDAIVIGDGFCSDAAGILDAAIANRATWSAAVNGPITLNTFDPSEHGDDGGPNLTEELTLNSINFAASGSFTGLYFTVGCYYTSDPITPLTILDAFGTFTVDDQSGNLITIVNGAHAVMTGLTEEGLSNWGSSTHEHFLTFPADFEILANEGGEVILEGQDVGVAGLPVALPVILAAAGATPTPTPTPTQAPTGTPTGSPTPAASLLPDTMTSLTGTDAGIVMAVFVLLLSGGLYGTIAMRRRQAGGAR